MYYFDTLEKKNDHIKKYFDRHQIPYTLQRLKTADYWNDENPNVLIDKKYGLLELAQNLCSDDKSRFWNEVRRSHKDKQKLIILVESSKIRSLQDVSEWKSKYTRLSGSRLQAEMYRVGIAYNIQFEFCSKQSTGKRIIELLSN